MIKVEPYGGGVRWSCTKCDHGHNGYISTIVWNNSPPPDFCDRCDPKGRQSRIEEAARKAMWRLAELHGDAFRLPGTVDTIAGLIEAAGLSCGYNPHRLAAIMNRWAIGDAN